MEQDRVSPAEWGALALRLFVAGLLLWGGVTQLTSEGSTEAVFSGVTAIPSAVASVLAVIAPFFLIVLGMLLVIGFAEKVCSTVAVLISLVCILTLTLTWVDGGVLDLSATQPFGGLMTSDAVGFVMAVAPWVMVMLGGGALTVMPQSALSVDRAMTRDRIRREVKREQKAYDKQLSQYSAEAERQRQKAARRGEKRK